ncbi:hypothetical protein CONLIGDRAFT_648127 [Coniochaeta ligniaria NRRL 30616]|uniref:Uncharacterized protein n=1 Tax=Coniochaeta ligniaria NRRL 30616 TaxID=1408157 RepID=A0A1J7ICB3_9PEZI|nr:hypothetical protein CONLIGDRAFT_648127 [Coniochaeta ligniaria NRRL 30616]
MSKLKIRGDKKPDVSSDAGDRGQESRYTEGEPSDHHHGDDWQATQGCREEGQAYDDEIRPSEGTGAAPLQQQPLKKATVTPQPDTEVEDWMCEKVPDCTPCIGHTFVSVEDKETSTWYVENQELVDAELPELTSMLKSPEEPDKTALKEQVITPPVNPKIIQAEDLPAEDLPAEDHADPRSPRRSQKSSRPVHIDFVGNADNGLAEYPVSIPPQLTKTGPVPVKRQSLCSRNKDTDHPTSNIAKIPGVSHDKWSEKASLASGKLKLPRHKGKLKFTVEAEARLDLIFKLYARVRTMLNDDYKFRVVEFVALIIMPLHRLKDIAEIQTDNLRFNDKSLREISSNKGSGRPSILSSIFTGPTASEEDNGGGAADAT